MRKRKLLLILAATVLAPMFFIVPSFAQQILRIGSFNPLTGPASFTGINADRGVDLCAEQWNKKGGVSIKEQKYRIQMIHEDDKYKGEEAVNLANKLIFTEKVKFIVGALGSACILAAQPITEANKIIMICNSFAGPELLRNKPYTFRAMIPPIHSGPGFFKVVTKRFPHYKTCVHISPNDATGWGSTQGDNDACHAMGVKVLASDFYEAGTQDFTPMLTKMIALKPDFISMGGTAGGYAALIIKQARELGYKSGFVHSGHFFPKEAGPIAGWENIEGVLTSSMSMGGPLTPAGVKKVGDDFMIKYGEAGEAGFAIGGVFYDYLNILLWGIEKANTLNADEVRVGIENLGEMNMITGKGHWGGMEFYGIKHQIIMPFTVSEVRNGKLVTAGVEMPVEVPLPQLKWR